MKRFVCLAIMSIFCLIQSSLVFGATDLQVQSFPAITEEGQEVLIHWPKAPPEQLKPYLSTMEFADEIYEAEYQSDGRMVLIAYFRSLPDKKAPTGLLIAAFCYTTSTDADGVQHYYMGELSVLEEYKSNGNSSVVYDAKKACP